MSGDTVVFVARVTVDSGEGWGTGPARVVVEEGLHNAPKEMEQVQVNTAAGTSCYRRLQAGERYVIFAGQHDGTLYSGGCSGTFEVRGNEHILDALRSQARGGPSRLTGTVLRSTGRYSHDGAIAGASVTADSGAARYEAFTDPAGRYEFRGIAPGKYQLSVAKASFAPDEEYNGRWQGRMIHDPATDKWEPDPDGTSIFVAESRCEIRNLSMSPDNRISGIVRDRNGTPLAGITVQGFEFDNKRQRESSPLRTSTTDAYGRYTLDRLPGADYAVGVNAETYHDRDAYPPTFYETGEGAARSMRVHVTEGQEVRGVDLVLPPKRTPATLRVQVLRPDGTPLAGETVQWENEAGVQRGSSEDKTNDDGWLEIKVYVGEKYVIKSSHYSGRSAEFDYLEGASALTVTVDRQSVTLLMAGKRFKR
jgi:hypothetical protein